MKIFQQQIFPDLRYMHGVFGQFQTDTLVHLQFKCIHSCWLAHTYGIKLFLKVVQKFMTMLYE